MAIRADIKHDHLWFRFEDRTIAITVTDEVTGDPTNLAGVSLLWRLKFAQNSATTYLTKETPDIQVSGAGSNVVLIPIDPDVDYEDLEAGIHYHELWDVDNNKPLAFGDAWLHPSSDPTPAP